MPSELLEIPLWDETGVLTTDPDYLKVILGLSDDLIISLIEWGLAYDAKPDEIPWSAYVHRGAELVERLRAEVGSRFAITTGPFS